MAGKLSPPPILEGNRRAPKTDTASAPNEYPASVGPRGNRYPCGDAGA